MWFLEEYMVYVMLAPLLALIVAIICIPKKSITTREIAISASCVALSFALSYASVSFVANGGSVTLASIVPLAVYCYYAGVRKGLLAALAFSVLQMFQAFYYVSPLQLLIDYILPFSAFGAVSLLKPLRKKLRGYDFAIMLTVIFIFRFFCHFLIGMLPMPIGWEYAPLASFLYQSTYVPADCAIAVVVVIVLVHTKAIERIEKIYLGNTSLAPSAEDTPAD